MKWLWFVLVFLLGGVAGFFVGGTGGMMAGGIAGTEFGVCAAVKVAGDRGLLSQDQAQKLLGETASHLRSEFSELVEKGAAYTLMKELGTKPRVYYLPPKDRAFPFEGDLS